MRRFLHTFFFILCVSLYTQAQICEGTLGDNIFTEGDFGEGAANLVSTNPNIAPGYQYTTNVPPIDGQYVITNNTGAWSNLFTPWLPIRDNSSNNNGYMMIVNASNEPGLFYNQTIDGLCENTLYEFSADIINLIRSGTSNHIDPNVSFLLDGVEVFSSGDIPKTNNWQTFGFIFTTDPGQTSLTLSLRNNAPGGIGNDLGLDNITFRACGPEVFIGPDLDLVFLCEDSTSLELEAVVIGDQYDDPTLQWQQSQDNGISWQDIPGETNTNFTPETATSGVFIYRFLLADGASNLTSEKCRVNSNIITLNIIPEVVMTFDTLCQGLERSVGSSIYTESGIYTDTLKNILGCDSVAITDITFIDSTLFTVDIIATPPSCPGFTDGSIAVTNLSGGFDPLNFTFEGEDLGLISSYTKLSGNATYNLLIQDRIGCIINTDIFIEDATDLQLQLGDDQTVELGESLILAPTFNFEPASFAWLSTTPVECTDLSACNLVDFIPLESQKIKLELFSEGQCSVADSIFVQVLDVRKVWVPNAFSPNSDGINDSFTIYGDMPNVQIIEELQIFDRWGTQVFEANNFAPNDLQSGWNGTYRDKPMQPGMYLYKATARFIDGEIRQYSGNLTLVL